MLVKVSTAAANQAATRAEQQDTNYLRKLQVSRLGSWRRMLGNVEVASAIQG